MSGRCSSALPCCCLSLHRPQSKGITNIATRVPDTHTVLLDIGEHGSVLIGGKTYTPKDKQVEIARLAEQTYTIQLDKGWQVEKVKYGQKDALETILLADNAFTAAAVNGDDNQLTVTFKKDSAGSGTDKPTSPDKGSGTGVKTGDTTNLSFTVALFLLSGSASVILYMKTVKRRKQHE